MKKKWLTAGVALGVGTVMLFASGFSAMANTSGYDTYKTALKNTKAQPSLTAKAEVTVTDNGLKLVSGTADIKLNQTLNTGNVNAVMGNGTQTHSMNVFHQDGKVILKSGDDEVYRVMGQEGSKWQNKEDMQGPPKAVEQVIDSLMGNMRELATVESESDGSKQAALHLSGSQVPAIVNALGTLAISKAADPAHWDHDTTALSDSSDSKVNMPKLVDNIKIQEINLDAKINPDQVIDTQSAEIKINGTDETGKNHALVIQLNVQFSDFNQTAPERIDLSGKKTEVIQNKWADRHEWKH